MQGRIFTFTFFIFALLSIPCQAAPSSPETIFVSIMPQKFFMQQICKDILNIEVMVAPGASPHTYEPRPSQMRKLAASRAYFAIGMPFEDAWLDKFIGVNPKLKIVDTDAGIEKLAMVEHHEGHSGGHEDDGSDPHIWLSPTLVKKQAETMTAALSSLFPDKAAFFRENLAAFAREIDILDNELRSTLKDKEGLRFMVFHPSWGYFARDYGLEQVAVEVEGKEPKPSQMQNLIQEARAQNIHVIFAQPQFSLKSAKLLAGEISGEVVLIDPLAENWFDNMRQVAGKLRVAAK